VAEPDQVFKALADPSRRFLLDSLRARNGQTLGELCAQLAMARQSVTQHLAILEDANLVTTVRRGREKLHYLNPVPIQEIQERWIERFERPRLRALSRIKQRAEGAEEAEEQTMEQQPAYVYTIFVESTPERVWHAITDPDVSGEYWGHHNVCAAWQAGAPWKHVRTDGSGIADVVGTVLVADPPRKLSMTFDAPGDAPAGGPSTVTFDIEPFHDIVRLTVTHQNIPDEQRDAVADGWPAVLSNLKSLLETGRVLSSAPWDMHAGAREEIMARNNPS
jgi:uncharacterized protein YndB with AHSA1/START domain/DNA-binding transcriptional ArsR family regulator